MYFLFIYLSIYLFIYRSFNDVIGNSGYTESDVSMIVHNGLENISGPVIVQGFIAGLCTQILAFEVHKLLTGFSEYFGLSCQSYTP